MRKQGMLYLQQQRFGKVHTVLTAKPNAMALTANANTAVLTANAERTRVQQQQQNLNSDDNLGSTHY